MEKSVQFVACTLESHATKILEIFNDAITTSTALFDYAPRAPESMVGWFKAKEVGRFPVIGAIAPDDQLFAHAVAANVALAQGNAAAHARHYSEAKAVAAQITDPETREMLNATLRVVPAPSL